MEKSKGHVMFLSNILNIYYEYFKGPDGTLYKAKASNYIGVDGYRVGARFEAMPSSADHCMKIIKG